MPIPIDNIAPLHGVRVLEAARILAGPYCGQILADLGAEVVKLERPGSGDDTRTWGPPFQGSLAAYFIACNRSKRSMTLDFATPAGLTILHQLLDQADVLLENFRTDSLEKLDLTPERLLDRHPRLIVCSISGYGRTGPKRNVAGYDFAIQAESGLMAITGPKDGPPSKVGVAVADVLTGLYASTAILACLRARESSGHGYAIDLALHDCALAAQVNVAQAYLSTGQVPPRQGNAHLQIVPYGLFPTADGWIVLNVGNDGQWQQFCKTAGALDLAADARFLTNPDRVRRREELLPLLEALLRSKTTAEWSNRLAEVNVPHALVRSYDDAFADEQTQARGMRVTIRDPSGTPVDLIGSPIRIQGAPPTAYGMPPGLGNATESVLTEWLRLDETQRAALRQAGVI